MEGIKGFIIAAVIAGIIGALVPPLMYGLQSDPETEAASRPRIVATSAGAAAPAATPPPPPAGAIVVGLLDSLKLELSNASAPAGAVTFRAENKGAIIHELGTVRMGGDPKKVFLAGHSAGATHVATYAAMPQFHAPGGVGLAGLILLSGNYDLSIVEPDERYVAYFGPEKSKYGERSPLAGLLTTQVPLFAAYTELEPPFLLEQSEHLLAALDEADREAHTVFLPNHNHISITYSIIEKHGGTLELLAAPERGTEARIALPLRDPNAS